jgi:hypothetical protein
MFTVHFPTGLLRPLRGHSLPARTSPGRVLPHGGILRLIVLSAALALGLPQMSSAQALGTMQVSARVVPASVAWAGVAEGREAARIAAKQRWGRPIVRRGGLLLTQAEIRPLGGRRLLIVTIHPPHN